jgi:hypothetical protein
MLQNAKCLCTCSKKKPQKNHQFCDWTPVESVANLLQFQLIQYHHEMKNCETHVITSICNKKFVYMLQDLESTKEVQVKVH